MKEPPSNPDEFKKVSVSIPRDLLDKIDQRAKVEYRNRSNMIAQLLREELAAYTTKADPKPHPSPPADAEGNAAFGVAAQGGVFYFFVVAGGLFGGFVGGIGVGAGGPVFVFPVVG